MRLEFKQQYWIGIVIGVIVLVLNFVFLFETRWFVAVIIISIAIASGNFWVDFYREVQRQKQIEIKFLEFIRSLVSSVRSGLPISKAILHVSNEDFGAFSPFVKKLSNQIEWGIPMHQALVTLGDDTHNAVIKRSVSIVIEADKSGGDIENVLQSVAQSVYSIKKIREKRKSETHSQVVQGYIVFYIFIAVMLMIQLWLAPQLAGLGGVEDTSALNDLDTGVLSGVLGSGGGDVVDLNRIFFFLVIIQGFFSGLAIGKFSEGSLKTGVLHSLILMVTATLIITLVKGGI